jgi:putative oxidoreductase
MSSPKRPTHTPGFSILASVGGYRKLSGWADWVLLVARLASGVVFVSFGLAKFFSHASETASFRAYGLPAPSALAYVIGAIEILGGIALLLGFATRLSSLVLAGDMVGAIIASGVLHGEAVSLTLAPALLIVMCVLLAFGSGSVSFDRRFAQHTKPRPDTPT